VCGLALHTVSFMGHITSVFSCACSTASMHSEQQRVTVPAHFPTRPSVESIKAGAQCTYFEAGYIPGMRVQTSALLQCKHGMAHLVCCGGLRLRALAKAHALANGRVLGGRQRLHCLVRGVRRAEQLQRRRSSKEVCSISKCAITSLAPVK